VDAAPIVSAAARAATIVFFIVLPPSRGYPAVRLTLDPIQEDGVSMFPHTPCT